MFIIIIDSSFEYPKVGCIIKYELINQAKLVCFSPQSNSLFYQVLLFVEQINDRNSVARSECSDKIYFGYLSQITPRLFSYFGYKFNQL